MAFDVDAYTAQLQSLLPSGKAWPRNQSSDLTKILRGISPELARVDGRGDDILRELNPGEAVEMLPEHESLNGVVAAGTTSQRQAALIAKLQDTSGHNPADYVTWWSTRGFSGAFVYRRPFHPFCAGSKAGSAAYGTPWVHAYVVEYAPNLTAFPTFPGDFNLWGASGATITINAAQGPDGTTSADGISGSPAVLTSAITPCDKPWFSVWLRAATGTPAVTATVGATALAIAPQVQWRRYELQSTSNAVSSVSLSISGSVYAWGGFVFVRSATDELAFGARQQAHAVPIYRAAGDWPGD